MALAGLAAPVHAEEEPPPEPVPTVSVAPAEPVPPPADPAAIEPAPPPPPIPTGLAVTGGSFRSGTVDWDDLPGAATYSVELAQSVAMDGAKEFPAPQSTATVFGLAPDHDYFVRVRGLDATGQPFGDWSPVVTARTTPAPEPPPEPPVTVASFNIRCANCYSGQNLEEPWSVRRDAVVAQTVARRPDVVGLQEASQARLKGTTLTQMGDLRDRLRAAGAPYELTNEHA